MHVLTWQGCKLLVGKLPDADLSVLEERGCLVSRPAPPPPKYTGVQPSYQVMPPARTHTDGQSACHEASHQFDETSTWPV